MPYSKAMQIAQALETADRNAKELEKWVEVHVYEETGNQPVNSQSAYATGMFSLWREALCTKKPADSNIVCATTVEKGGT